MSCLPVLRVARPSDDVEALLPFYRDGLGLDVLHRFRDHEGFDGAMLGHAGAPYHFEFTRAHGHDAGQAPTQDNLLIFYLPDHAVWQKAVDRMEAAGFRAVPSFNRIGIGTVGRSRTPTAIASSSRMALGEL